MQALLYADLTQKRLSETLGGSAFTFPKLVQGDTVVLALRLAQRVGGETAEVTRVCQQLKVTLGGQDERPVSGSWRLHIGEDAPVVNVNVTGALAWNATAEQVRSAIGQLTTLVPTYGACTVELVDGSYLIRWAAHNAIVPLVVHSNQLWPVSFVRVRETQLGGIWVHEVRLMKAPLAAVSTFAEVVPGAPEITALTDGGENTGVKWGEVQKLVVPPAFRGVYCIKRGSSKSANLSIEDGPDEIAAALDPLADEDGEFLVTNPTPNAAHIEFGGSMAGIDQPLLEVEVFDAPAGDLKFRLNLGTAEMDSFLRRSATGEETLPLEIELLLEDENDEEITDKITFRMDVVVQRETTWDELSQPAGIDWLRPPQPRDYVPFTPDQVAVGILHWTTTMGDGAATVFVLDHNLGSESVLVMVRENTTPGAVLRLGTDYTVEITDEDSVTVTVLGDYADPVPAEGALAVTIQAMGQASAFNAHTHTVGQIVGLQAILDGLGARLEALEDLVPTGAVVADPVAAQGVISSWDLPKIAEVYPVRSLNLPVPGTGLAGFNQALLPRVGGLLAAVHDAVVETLTVPLVAVSDSLKGKVFKNESASTVLLPGGMGRKSVQLRPGEHATCDGRMWYRVDRMGSETSWYPTDYARELFRISVNDKQLRLKKKLEVLLGIELAVLKSNTNARWALRIEWATMTEDATPTGAAITVTADAGTNALTAAAHGLVDGTPVKVASSGTVPGGLAVGTTYYVQNADTNTLQLSAALGGAAVDLTSAGTGTITVTAQTGRNLKEVVWNPEPLLEQVLEVTPVPGLHMVGCRITRALVESEDTITATRILYGSEEGGAPAPTGANFMLRGRLVRFDTENGESDPRGFVALLGLDKTVSVEESSSESSPGKAVIKSA